MTRDPHAAGPPRVDRVVVPVRARRARLRFISLGGATPLCPKTPARPDSRPRVYQEQGPSKRGNRRRPTRTDRRTPQRSSPKTPGAPLASRRLASFERAVRRHESVDRAWRRLGRRGLPLVEPIPRDPSHLLVTFVWRPGVRLNSPSVYTPLADFAQGETELHSLGRSGVWYRSFRLHKTTRASYGFSRRPMPPVSAVGMDWARYMQSIRPDPCRSERIRFGPSLWLSVFELPDAPAQPWTVERGPSRWKEEHRTVRSRKLQNSRAVWVFLPPNFAPKTVRYNLLLVFDGPPYLDPIPTPRIVENLVAARRLSPTVVVLLGNAPDSREEDLLLNPAFPEFLAGEFLPWMRRRYGLRSRASTTVLAGSSIGGVAAAYSALQHPELFGNVLVQSGSFLLSPPPGGRGPRSLAEEFARAPRRRIRFYLDGGTHETMALPGAVESLLGGVRHFRDVLEAKGYPVVYSEFEGGHDYACWRGTIADGLLGLIGRT